MFAVEFISAARVLRLAQQVGVDIYPLDRRWAGTVSVIAGRERARKKQIKCSNPIEREARYFSPTTSPAQHTHSIRGMTI